MGKGIVKLGEGNWAVKDGNLLAAKETNGRFKNAEFTVTRGTDATYVGKDGLIKTASFYNLVTYSEDFSQWTGLVALSIGLNQGISPNGLTEANLLSIGIDSSSTRHRLYNLFDFVSGDTYTYSIFAKKNENDWFQLMFSASAFDAESYANFDLNNGVVGNKGTSTTANITYYGNGWYRCSITCTASTSVTTTYELLTTNNTNSGRYPSYQSSAAVNVCFLWGAQLVEGTEALDYQYTNGKEGIPRIDFTDNTDGHLLLEPQSTNLITYSEDFSSSNWSHLVSASVDPNVVVSPDGTQNASRLNFHQGSTTSRIEKQILGQTTGSYTFSVWAKSATNENVQFEMEIGSAGTGTVAKTATSDWQRFEITGSVSSGTVNLYPQIESYTSTNPSIYIWGAQFEKLSYATSYIPTNGSTVTRDAETCTGAGEAADFNSSEGVLYAEIAALADTDTTNPNRGLSISSGSTNNTIFIYFQSALNTLACILISNGTTQFSHSTSLFDVDNYLKIALKYKQDDFALWVNGVEVATDTIGNVPIGLNELAFDNGVGVDKFYGKCKAIRVYKEALSDSELTTLTS